MNTLRFAFLLSVWFALVPGGRAAGGVLEIHNGYFWDPQAEEYFVPRGMAYQVWNPPVGANQSFGQLEYDMLEFKKLRANSVRCEMVWGELETEPGQYDWSKPDRLVALAERLGLRLFVLIGFQYPPAWFPRELRGINAEGLTPPAMARLAAATPAGAFEVFPARTVEQLRKAVSPGLEPLVRAALVEGAREYSVSRVLELLEARLPAATAAAVSRLMISDVINWEHPQARELYTRHLAAVTARYRESAAVGGWIMGNEYAYFDLWEDPVIYGAHRFIGYDAVSQESFRRHLRGLYQSDIAALNANWGTAYEDFTAVEMPAQYPADRISPAYHDLIQWRKTSIGDFVAAGAKAARQTDPRHLQTYSMVGGVFSGRDANNTAEDARAIVERCRAAGAPLDFWSINNYANAALGSELRSADFGVGKYQAESGLPVMISETGHSSTENLLDPDSGARQAKALPGQLWESLVSGAIGTHAFHWSDRSQFNEKYFLRERGFGIVEPDRQPKPGVYTNMARMFRQMEEAQADRLLGGSLNPPADVQFFWSTNADMVWPRANQENAMMWGALKRAGFQPGIISDAEFRAGAFTNAAALLLSRAWQMNPEDLGAIATRVLPSGVHVHANADLPGQFDAFHRPNPNWAAQLSSIFGIDVSRARHTLHNMVTVDEWAPLALAGVAPLPPLAGAGYRAAIRTWNAWDGVQSSNGRLIARHAGVNDGAPNSAALVVKTHPKARTAITTFALGDSGSGSGTKEQGWDFRLDWIEAIYRGQFGMRPVLELTGPNARYVMPDYRILANGGILISLLNEHTEPAAVTVSAAGLLRGQDIESLTGGGVIERNSDGAFTANLAGDDYLLFYVHGPGAPSPIHSDPARVWFESAPVVVHPRTADYPLTLGFDATGADAQLELRFEHADGRAISASGALPVSGKGQGAVRIAIPDFDAENAEYRSTADGGGYRFRAILSSGGAPVAETAIPVRLAWLARPLAPLPIDPAPGQVYALPFEWEELPAADPSDPTPFDRARVWGAIDPARHAYQIRLNLLNASGAVLGSDATITRNGSGTNIFHVAVPAGAQGRMAWSAEVSPARLQTRDIFESFEDRNRGAKWPDELGTDFLGPWHSFKYPPAEIAGIDLWQNEGVQLIGSDGSQSAFLVVTNPPGLVVSTFGFTYQFPGGPWALPAERARWTNWTLSFDFREKYDFPCLVELQIKNDDPNGEGKWLQKSLPYAPGGNGWMTVRASLAEFVPPPGLFGVFDPAQFKEIVLGIRMLKEGAQYVGSFDNIVFDGPDEAIEASPPLGGYASANDSAGVLAIGRVGTARVRVSWTGPGELQWAEQVEGPWAPVPEQANPQTPLVSAPRRYYRLLR